METTTKTIQQIQTPEEVVSFGFATPEAKDNRMNWRPNDFPAAEILTVDVRMTSAESKNGSRPYAVFTFDGQPIIAVMVEQLMADTGNQLVVSQPGQDIEIDMAVGLGVRDGKFYVAV